MAERQIHPNATTSFTWSEKFPTRTLPDFLAGIYWAIEPAVIVKEEIEQEELAHVTIRPEDNVEGRFFTSRYSLGHEVEVGQRVQLRANGKYYESVVESVYGDNVVLVTEWVEAV